ncbi:MAG TPA: TerC family protein [Actinomycetota bacterium]|nr:TerC family protein [Actinomycetota bacterium]
MTPWYLYAGFIGFVIAMLLVDLKFFHTREREPSMKESGAWVAVWVGLALVFGVIVFFWKGPTSAAEYFAGYVVEYSLSVDNMFVFVVIFAYFAVPFAYQHQVLFYGILGAMIFRGIFIALGVTLIQNFEWILYVFGAFLVLTAYRIAKGSEEVHPEENAILKFLQRRLRTTTRYEGQRFFVMENGRRTATPLLVVLVFIELTDIVFAVDSIPAIFGITLDPFIVLTSNVFAILGLRALYFLLAGSMGRFHLLKYGLAIILAFVGIKMLLTAISCGQEALFCHDGHVTIPIWMSLAFIISVLAVTAFLSLRLPPKLTAEKLPRHPEVLDDDFPDGARERGVPDRHSSGDDGGESGERG